MTRRFTAEERAARAQARYDLQLADIDRAAAELVADWPPIPPDALRRIALIFDPPSLVDLAQLRTSVETVSTQE